MLQGQRVASFPQLASRKTRHMVLSLVTFHRQRHFWAVTQGGSLLLSKEKAGLCTGVQRTLGSRENYQPRAFAIKAVMWVEKYCEI